jgi:hypothetical protein
VKEKKLTAQQRWELILILFLLLAAAPVVAMLPQKGDTPLQPAPTSTKPALS